VVAIAQWEQAVVDRELKLQEREEQDDHRLDRELKALASHESKLNSHEASLETEWKSLEEIRAEVLGHKLATDTRDECLNSRAAELVDREKHLVERQL
jgi:hypothetical protein